MKFRDMKARKDGNVFEIKFSSYSPYLKASVDPYYVDITPAASKRVVSTEATRRFKTKDDAEAFCQDIVSGKVSIADIYKETEAALTKFAQKKKEAVQKEAMGLLDILTDLGVSYNTAIRIHSALGGTSMEAKEYCGQLEDLPDPARRIQENIVNISMKASEMLVQHDIDLDDHEGYQGLTNFIIESAKRFEKEFGAKTDFNSPDAPDYWESIDDFAECELKREFEDALVSPMDKKPLPEKVADITLGEWMDKYYQSDIDVCLVDKDTAEHYRAAIVHLTPEEKKTLNLDYNDEEKWLRSLSLSHIPANPDQDSLAVVVTEFNTAQTDFLLGYQPEGIDCDVEAATLSSVLNRANMAGAGFSERLAYLQNGTSFEKLFDGNSMDAVDPDYRQKLVQLLRNGNVFCGEDKYGNFAYSLHKTPAGFEVVDDCIEIKMTEPGEGLFSTLEGKMYLSAQKSHKENGEHSILEKTNSAAIDR